MMNILMFSNTFKPCVGGVTHSISMLRKGLIDHNHHVLIVAPRFDGFEADEPGIIRVPAWRRFRGDVFSVPLPLSRRIKGMLDDFAPDVVHSHHPFLLGDTALRVAANRGLPTVLTYHTRYEHYGHYLGFQPPRMTRLIRRISIGYGNLCDALIAPGPDLRSDLLRAGVTVPIHVIPTGLAPEAFACRNRAAARRRFGLAETGRVVGHAGRLAFEKNLPFLANAMVLFLHQVPDAKVLIAGDGPVRQAMQSRFAAAGLANRAIFAGMLSGDALADFYAASDIFAFSSETETQGLVLAEAMAAGCVVVALDVPAARRLLKDGQNGRLVWSAAEPAAFARDLVDLSCLTPEQLARLSQSARQTARRHSLDAMVQKVVALYADVIAARSLGQHPGQTVQGQNALRGALREMRLLANLAMAIGQAALPGHDGSAGQEP